MLGLLVADKNKAYVEWVRHVVEENFKGQINVFQALYEKEALRALEKLPIDMMIINFEMTSKLGIEFLTDIRKMAAYKKAPLIIRTVGKRVRVESVLMDEAYQIGILDQDDDGIQDRLRLLLERAIFMTEETEYLRFTQKSRVISIPIRNFILAEPSISGGRKTTIIYIDEKTGLIVEDIITAYTLEKILSVPHRSKALIRLNNSMVINLNRIEGVRRTTHEVVFRDISRVAKIGGTYRDEIYRLLGVF